MECDMDKHEVHLDRLTRGVLCLLTALLVVIAVELWVAMPSSAPAAMAQIPDTGLQRQQIVEETRRTNQLLEQILEQLKTGTVKVKWESADKPLTDRQPVKGQRGGKEKKNG
jgi:uncharacterized protein YpmS